MEWTRWMDRTVIPMTLLACMIIAATCVTGV